MRPFYNNYGFPDNLTNWLRSERPYEQNGVRYAREIQITLMGIMLGDTTSLALQQNQMAAACSSIGGVLSLKDNNNNTIELLGSSGARIPVQTALGPNFGKPMPGEYATYRSFSVVFRGVYPAGPTGLVILQSTISYWQDFGGPSIVWVPSSNGPRIRQSPEPGLPHSLTHSGMVVTRNLPFVAPAPGALRPAAFIQFKSGQGTTERLTETGSEYATEWRHIYEDQVPF